jgi:hypothetical protein
VLTHIPDTGKVTTRYYRWYANRPRGIRRHAEPTSADAPALIVTAPRLARRAKLRHSSTAAIEFPIRMDRTVGAIRKYMASGV